jgi:hypothetical protein
MAPRVFKKSRFEYIQGKLSWVRVVKPDPTYNCWKAAVHPTPESLDKIRDLQAEGLKNVLKKDEDGYYTNFRCPVSRQRKDGSVWSFPQPVVLGPDGNPMDGSIIGNGSDGTLKLEVYEHATPGGGKAVAARLVGVKVESLVPFDPDKDETEDEANANGDLRKQTPLF